MMEGECGTPLDERDVWWIALSRLMTMQYTRKTARVEAALKTGAGAVRTTLILRDIEDLCIGSRGAAGVNLGTVKSRLVRGRAHLKGFDSAGVLAFFPGARGI